MRRKSLIKWVVAPSLAVAVLLIIGFLIFVPFAREPSYRFVASWGTEGTAPGAFQDPTGIAVAGLPRLTRRRLARRPTRFPGRFLRHLLLGQSDLLAAQCLAFLTGCLLSLRLLAGFWHSALLRLVIVFEQRLRSTIGG